MTQGDKRKKRKKYRVRYDRIIVLILIIAIIAVLVSSCMKWISGDNEKDNESGNQNSVSDNSGSAPDEPTLPDENEPTSEAATSATEAAGSSAENSAERSHDDIYKGDLIVVNADHEYKFPDGDIEVETLFDHKNECYGAGDYVTKLDKNTLSQLNEMMSAYAAYQGVTSTDVFVLDGYRTFEEQADRHSSGKSKTFEAGHTDYHTGRTFDMFRNDQNSGSGYSYFTADAWFEENAGNYGFIVRYPEGKSESTGENPRTYTYRFVGIPHASYINANRLSLEEYIDEVKRHTIEEPLTIEAGGKSYSVYYVAAQNEGNTSVPIPADKMYSISGDNDGGFIVTVTLD